MERKAEEKSKELVKRETKLDERETKLDERETKLDERETQLDEYESKLNEKIELLEKKNEDAQLNYLIINEEAKLNQQVQKAGEIEKQNKNPTPSKKKKRVILLTLNRFFFFFVSEKLFQLIHVLGNKNKHNSHKIILIVSCPFLFVVILFFCWTHLKKNFLPNLCF